MRLVSETCVFAVVKQYWRLCNFFVSTIITQNKLTNNINKYIYICNKTENWKYNTIYCVNHRYSHIVQSIQSSSYSLGQTFHLWISIKLSSSVMFKLLRLMVSLHWSFHRRAGCHIQFHNKIFFKKRTASEYHVSLRALVYRCLQLATWPTYSFLYT